MPDDASVRVTRALLSVSDKSGLVPFAKTLAAHNIELLSTGGTAKALRDAGLTVIDVSDHTGFPEIMDGRVKTLHPSIHGGLLGRRDDAAHQAAMSDHDIAPIDMIVINLYPFEQTVAAGADFDTCVENIDIGGPAMIRSAAKNHQFVAVITDPADYEDLTKELMAHKGGISAEKRRALAAAAFARTAAYDAAISGWFARQTGSSLPDRITIAGTRQEILRYGENPHQKAAFYRSDPAIPGVATATQIQGKALSYNNLNDTDAAFALACDFDETAVAIIKHANPCGVALGATAVEAYEKALACDPVSAFGGIIAVNREIDARLAVEITKLFAEVVIAPRITENARSVFAKKANLRILETGATPNPDTKVTTFQALNGGFLVQDQDRFRLDRSATKIVSRRQPTDQEWDDMMFAFRVCKHVKSNAIVFAKDRATVGIGAGQMSRVDSSRIAAWKADAAAESAGESEPRTTGSVVASDAFFPFADGLLAAARAGASAIIQPGGSIRDEEVIAAADGEKLAMVFTGVRHFRH